MASFLEDGVAFDAEVLLLKGFRAGMAEVLGK
jgi:hypothetical protein